MASMGAVLMFCALVLGASAQMPPSIWKWPGSNSSVLPTEVPSYSTKAEYIGISSCGGGGDPNRSFACPHFMLLSPDMVLAAKADGNDWAVYGVAGIGQVTDSLWKVLPIANHWKQWHLSHQDEIRCPGCEHGI